MPNNTLFGLPDLQALQDQKRANLLSIPSAMASLPRGRGPVFAATLLGAAIGDSLTTSALEEKIGKVKKAYEFAGKEADIKDPLQYMLKVAEGLKQEGMVSEAMNVLFSRNQLLMSQEAQRAAIDESRAEAAYKQNKLALEQAGLKLDLMDTLSQKDYREALAERTRLMSSFLSDKKKFSNEMDKVFEKDPNHVFTPEERFKMIFFQQTPEAAIDMLLYGSLEDVIRRVSGGNPLEALGDKNPADSGITIISEEPVE